MTHHRPVGTSKWNTVAVHAWYALFRRHGLKKDLGDFRDYEKGKDMIDSMNLDPWEREMAVAMLVEYLCL